MTCHIINIINWSYDNFLQNILRYTSHCAGHRNRITNFEKDYIFTTLNPKILFEETQNACSPNKKSSAFMSYFVCIL